jgi:hypothetical protein
MENPARRRPCHRRQRASVVRKMEADANAAVMVIVIGPWNKMIAHYPAFSLKATATMPRESEAHVDRRNWFLVVKTRRI